MAKGVAESAANDICVIGRVTAGSDFAKAARSEGIAARSKHGARNEGETRVGDARVVAARSCEGGPAEQTTKAEQIRARGVATLVVSSGSGYKAKKAGEGLARGESVAAVHLESELADDEGGKGGSRLVIGLLLRRWCEELDACLDTRQYAEGEKRASVEDASVRSAQQIRLDDGEKRGGNGVVVIVEVDDLQCAERIPLTDHGATAVDERRAAPHEAARHRDEAIKQGSDAHVVNAGWARSQSLEPQPKGFLCKASLVCRVLDEGVDQVEASAPKRVERLDVRGLAPRGAQRVGDEAEHGASEARSREARCVAIWRRRELPRARREVLADDVAKRRRQRGAFLVFVPVLTLLLGVRPLIEVVEAGSLEAERDALQAAQCTLRCRGLARDFDGALGARRARPAHKADGA